MTAICTLQTVACLQTYLYIMSKQLFIQIILAACLLGFIGLALSQITEKRQLELRNDIELRSTEVQLRLKQDRLIELEEKYEAGDIERQELEQEIEALRADLQAKKQREAQEAEKMARAAQRASGTATASAAFAGSGSCEQYRHLVAQYSWDTNTMMRAMQLESSCNPNAVGDQYVIGGIYAPSCGLLQVRTLPGRPSCEQLKDPAFNIATAYEIWKGQGYRAWTVLH